ncbi:hypothetical protein I7I51_05773 [Histoplasma capsulatum]|uniref:Uncharacterized protein n=1 Tax=Ajellomyces capsulatus TaxID=5037 RepID=A0A8A1M9W2_AJECA|nr:hypothetical protein I7I51_05773 [Histoplasma capsulatum]
METGYPQRQRTGGGRTGGEESNCTVDCGLWIAVVVGIWKLEMFGRQDRVADSAGRMQASETDGHARSSVRCGRRVAASSAPSKREAKSTKTEEASHMLKASYACMLHELIWSCVAKN